METILNQVKKAVFYYIVSIVMSLVLLLGFFIIGGFPPAGVFIVAHAIVYSYTIYRGWHNALWKIVIQKEKLTEEEKEEMFDI